MERWFIKAKRELESRGLIYDDLAAHLGVSTGAVGHYMVGRREPTLEQLRKIAGFLNMSLSELLESDPFFLIDDNEKSLISVFRSLTEDDRSTALRLLDAMKKPPVKKSFTDE